MHAMPPVAAWLERVEPRSGGNDFELVLERLPNRRQRHPIRGDQDSRRAPRRSLGDSLHEVCPELHQPAAPVASVKRSFGQLIKIDAP